MKTRDDVPALDWAGVVHGGRSALGAAVREALASPARAIIVRGLPRDPDNASLLQLATRLGTPVPMSSPDAESGCIRRCEVAPDRQGRVGGRYREFSADAMPCHTDGAARERPYGVVLMHCVRPAARGGASWLAPLDEVLAGLGRDELALLRQPRFPFPFGAAPILSGRGAATTVRYHRAEIEATAALRGHAFAPAERAVMDRLDAFHRYAFRLEALDCLVIDNARLLHGREAFASDSDRLLLQLRVDASTPRNGWAA